MRAYSHYIFDLYGTLADIRTDESAPRLWRGLAEVYARRGALYTPGELKTAYRRLCGERIAAAELPWPEIRIEEVFARLYTEKGRPAEPAAVGEAAAAFRRLSTTRLRCYAGAAELLGALGRAGRGVYLLSNAQRVFTEPELRTLGLWDRFDDIVISSDHGCRKPDPRLYRVLLDRHRLDPVDCLMIGNDRSADIRGAAAVGMDSYLIRSGLSPRSEDPLSPAPTWAQDGMDLRTLRRRLLRAEIKERT